MGSGESRFSASLIVMSSVTRQCPQMTVSEDKGESKWGIEPEASAHQPNTLPLGHTGSIATIAGAT